MFFYNTKLHKINQLIKYFSNFSPDLLNAYFNLFFTLPFLSFNSSTTLDEGKEDYKQVPEITANIVLDGRLDEPVWANALKFSLNYEVQPAENVPPPVKTDVYLIYSKSGLYVGIQAFDDPKNIIANYHSRDDAFTDDWVGFTIDTYNDEKRSFTFIANPLGIQTDAIESGFDFDENWDAIWDSVADINEEGYIVEFFIPFSSLRFQKTKGDQIWGFDAFRSLPRQVRHHLATLPRDRDNDCYLCQVNKIKGFSGIKSGKNIELVPTLTYQNIKERENGTTGPFVVSEEMADIGATLKWGITPNIVLSGVYNPDFSTVEVDNAVLSVNEPFALFFPEKRSFFTESSDFFEYPLQAIYTRSVRQPSWGFKVSGKEKTHSIGTFLVRDDFTNFIVPGSEGSDNVSQKSQSTAFVFRYKKDVLKNSTIGLLLNNKTGDAYYNRNYGIDGNIRITKNDRLFFHYTGTNTRYPSSVVAEYNQQEGDVYGHAQAIYWEHNARTWGYFVGLDNTGDTFRLDQGFYPKVDYKEITSGVEYSVYPKKENSWWTRYKFGGDFFLDFKQNNDVLRRNFAVDFFLQAKLQSFFFVKYIIDQERFSDNYYKENILFSFFRFRPFKSFSFGSRVILGDKIDYDNERLAKRVRLAPECWLRMSKFLIISAEHAYERLFLGSSNIYTANVSNVNLNLFINPKISLKSTMQYVDYKRNLALYNDPTSFDSHTQDIYFQLLFSYKLNPHTAFYISYTQNYFNDDNITRLAQTGNGLFVKFSYAFVL